MKVVKVFIIDDSSFIRKLLTQILSVDAAIQVLGSASDPVDANTQLRKLKPDVITLDVEMPKMDGITFLGHLMKENPLPVVMVSAFTAKGADVTLKALELGAVDYISKPEVNLGEAFKAYSRELINKVKTAAGARINPPSQVIDLVINKPRYSSSLKQSCPELVIAIGASTGGTEALKEVLCKLPESSPAIVMTQHIPIAFSQHFAQRLNSLSAIQVVQAEEGQAVFPGYAYLAPGDRHLTLAREGSNLVCRLLDSEPVNRHKPSVEVMFKSVAQQLGSHAIALLLTGMGDDGADAMGIMRAAGATTIAQNKETSVVWGMPGEAVKRGHAEEVLALPDIAERLLYHVSRQA